MQKRHSLSKHIPPCRCVLRVGGQQRAGRSFRLNCGPLPRPSPLYIGGVCSKMCALFGMYHPVFGRWAHVPQSVSHHFPLKVLT